MRALAWAFLGCLLAHLPTAQLWGRVFWGPFSIKGHRKTFLFTGVLQNRLLE